MNEKQRNINFIVEAWAFLTPRQRLLVYLMIVAAYRRAQRLH